MDTYIAPVSAKFDAHGAWTLLPLSSGQLYQTQYQPLPSQVPIYTPLIHPRRDYVLCNQIV